MAYRYTFIVSEIEPLNLKPGTFWLHNSSGILQLKIGNWAQLNSGDNGLNILDGAYTRETAIQPDAPGSPNIGDIWIDNNNSARIYLGRWIELISGFSDGGTAGNGDLSLISEDLENMSISQGQIAIKLTQAQAFWYLGNNFVPFAGTFAPGSLTGAVTCFINGVFSNEYIQTKSLKIINSINERVDTCSFKYYKSGLNNIDVGARIDIYESKNIIKIFGGIITKIRKEDYYPSSTTLEYTVTCASWEKRLQAKIVSEVYRDQKAGNIIKNLFDEYLPEFSYDNVADGLTIVNMSFNYLTLLSCIKKIAKETGYNWYIDYEKDIHFFASTTNIAPFALSDTSNNFTKFQINYDSSQIRNRALIKGGFYFEAYNDDIQVADGEQIAFRTAFEPFSPVLVYVDTGAGFQPKTLGIQNINTSGFDFVLNQSEKTVQNLDLLKLASGDIIKITYNRRVPFFSEGQDDDSIDRLKLLEDGDGVHDITIKDDNIVSVEAANQRIQAELDDYANPTIKGSFVTYHSGLRSGQLLNINLSNFAMDVSYLIQKISIKIFIDDNDSNNTVLQYNVEFMTLLKGLQEFLLELYNSGREIKVGKNEIINSFRKVAGDTVSISDTLSYTAHSGSYLYDDVNSKWDFAQWS